MYKNLRLSLFYCFIVSISSGLLLSSCEKVPGHAVVPSGSTGTGGTSGGVGTGCTVVLPTGTLPNTNGIGNVAVGATNTIIFQVNNGSPVTILPSAYPFTTFFEPTGSTTNGPVTTITAANIVSGDNVDINYNSLSLGIYDAVLLNIAIPPYDLVSTTAYGSIPAMGTEKFNVTTQNVTGTNTGTIKGTFDGYMVDSCMNKLRVAGSFNISK